MRLLALFTFVFASVGCTDPDVFTLQPVPAQIATVGEELQLELEIVDLGGIVPRFTLSSPTLPDLMSRLNPPRFTVFGN
jgi:hypothetical protein